MPAIPPHDTGTAERPWSKSAALLAAPKKAAALRPMHAWVDPEGDPDGKGSYKFPHHFTPGGPADLPAVRNALARLGQDATDIPASDVPAVRRHLQRHLEAGRGG